jgi:hypothetical protein
MPNRNLLQRALFSGLVVVVCLLGLVAPAGARPSGEATLNCSISILGENPDHSLRMSPMRCTTGIAQSSSIQAAASSVLAIHYRGYNWTGATLTIYGGACSGGWLNLPAGWVNAIASTRSWCATSHYSGPYLTGISETTYGPGGNLTYMAYGSASVVYN